MTRSPSPGTGRGVPPLTFSGRLTTGRGEAAGFTCLDWVRDQFLTNLGIDPYPGTVNLVVDTEADRNNWSALQSRPGIVIDPPDARWCRARCYPVRLDGSLPAAIVLPEVPGYEPGRVEITAALPLRQTLGIADGDRVVVEAREALAVRAVIFDVDGTLVDSLAAFRIVAEQAAAPYGLTIADSFVRQALNTTGAFWDLTVPTDFANRAETLAALSAETSRLWPGVVREHAHVFPEAGSVLRALRSRGARLGIVTGSRGASLAPIRDAGLTDLFEAVVTRDHVERTKPDPQGLVRCAVQLQVSTAEAVYVGDTPLDIQAARSAGMFAVGLLGGAGDSALLSACRPDWIVGCHRGLLDALA
jgi:HAD superfamily hydrolase (TIGR01509 family)